MDHDPRHRDCRRHRAAFTVHKATEVPASAVPRAPGVELITIPRTPNRPGGRRFGTLVHAILTDVELDSPAARVTASAELHARVIGATEEETLAAAETVSRALLHPLIMSACRAERCHREFPLVLKLANGELVEGIADLAWLAAGEWTVVDFKTDADLTGRRAKYERQLQVYSIGLAPTPVRAYLLSL
jgi:hypothetical protein